MCCLVSFVLIIDFNQKPYFFLTGKKNLMNIFRICFCEMGERSLPFLMWKDTLELHTSTIYRLQLEWFIFGNKNTAILAIWDASKVHQFHAFLCPLYEVTSKNSWKNGIQGKFTLVQTVLKSMHILSEYEFPWTVWRLQLLIHNSVICNSLSTC